MSQTAEQTIKQRIVNLIYEQASQVLAERATTEIKSEQLRLEGERDGLRYLLKTIEREIED